MIYTTREIINWIEEERPESIKFVVDQWSVNSIAVFIMTERYETLVMCYGTIFCEAVLEFLISVEEYEACAKIKSSIDRVNKLIAEHG